MSHTEAYAEIGKRIQLARTQAGFSQERLASELDFKTTATISHFETGKRKVSVVDLQRIAALLNVPINYFFGVDIHEAKPLVSIKFRTQGLLPKQRDQFQPFIDFAENHAKTPANLLSKNEGLDVTGAIGRIAKQYLDHANIHTTPVDPRLIAQHIGIPVFEWEMPDEISGLTLAIEDRVCIGVNQEHPNVRQRFSIAHEIGHVVLHVAQPKGREAYVNVEMNDVEAGKLWAMEGYKQEYSEEREANWFAADLLMPSHLLREDYERGRTSNLHTLARAYDVSQQALYIQLKSLRLAN